MNTSLHVVAIASLSLLLSGCATTPPLKPPASFSVVKAVITDKEQPFAKTYTPTMQVQEVENRSFRLGQVYLIVGLTFPKPSVPNEYVFISSHDVKLVYGKDEQILPILQSSYTDQDGRKRSAWNVRAFMLVITENSEPHIEVLFVVVKDRLDKYQLQFFDKIVPLVISKE